MRRLILMALALSAALPAASFAHGVGEPATHGPDPAAIDRGGEPAPRSRARAAGGRAGASSRLPARWCGAPSAGDNKQNELSNGAHRFHAVYAHPSDKGARLPAVANGIQTSAMAASNLIEAIRGRAIRFDMGTTCGPAYLDISVLRLPQTTAELARLAGTPEGTLGAVSDALDAAGFGVIRGGDSRAESAARTRNWVVWLDGPGPGGACGQAMLYDDPARHAGNLNNLGGKVAVVFRNGEGFCGASTVRHEIAHNLGAVLSSAPHASGGHCTDAIEDTMCIPGSPQVADGAYHARYFDYGSDDYWDPPGRGLPWWTVNLNRFLCPSADCNVPPGFSGAQASDDGDRSENLRVGAEADRYRRGRWRLRIRVKGSGPALVSVSCRRPGERNKRVVWKREVDAPDRTGLRVKCASYPRTSVQQPDGVYVIARAKRYAERSWRVDVRVRGDKKAEVVLRCRRRRGGPVDIIWHRHEVQTPETYPMRVRCASLPRASARPE
ncbi:MAG: hypothetical protein WD844_15095 [Thermoleophilaceae bacterium]